MSTFLKLEVGDVGKLTKLAAAARWDLGLYQGLGSLSPCTHDLGIAALHLLQALLVLLAKAHVSQELGVHRLRDFYLCDQGFLMLFLCGFWDCDSWTWPHLHRSLQLPKCLGPEAKQRLPPIFVMLGPGCQRLNPSTPSHFPSVQWYFGLWQSFI